MRLYNDLEKSNPGKEQKDMRKQEGMKRKEHITRQQQSLFFTKVYCIK